MQQLLVQLSFEMQRFNVSNTNKIETVFIGGGTPSTIDATLYKPLFKMIQPYLQTDAEITIEANPNSASKEWLESIFALGVNRVSFGVQSFDEQKLKLLNRAHNKTQALNAIQNAKEVGFENISLDLIYGVSGDTQVLLEDDLQTAFALPINHLSAYALTIEQNTPFEQKPQMAQERLQTTQWFFDEIKKYGFTQYEISNFGRYHSQHNLGYWQYKEYMGVGSGAVGRFQNQRLYPTSDVENYIKDPLNIATEELTEEDMKIEKILLGLRCCVGVAKKLLTQEELQRAMLLVDEKKLLLREQVFYNTDYLLADEIALYITQ